MGEYVITHLHTQETNGVIVEVPSSLKDYLEEIKTKDGVKSLIVTNHGNKLGWFKHYQLMKKYGHKYIHAVEGYTCLNGDDKYNFHILLYGLNFLGFEEINELISASYQRDGHFYKRPRMFIDEILKCENIIISTACSGGIFAESKEEDKENSDIVKSKILEWGLENKDKLFLEIQPHIYNKQIIVNNEVLKLYKQGYNIICSNDVHYTNSNFKEIRKIISMDKNSGDEFELVFDLSIKSYDEQLKNFVNVGIEKSIVEEALANTIKLHDMCEEYEIDCGFKYPQIYDDTKTTLMLRCVSRLYSLDYIKQSEYGKYIERIDYELGVMEKLGSLSYMNLFSDWLSWCKEVGIAIGYSRGSASGSLVAYLTKITNMDSLMWDMSFERFMNPLRQGLADIDLDIQPSRRQEARGWFFNHPQLNSFRLAVQYSMVLW